MASADGRTGRRAAALIRVRPTGSTHTAHAAVAAATAGATLTAIGASGSLATVRATAALVALVAIRMRVSATAARGSRHGCVRCRVRSRRNRLTIGNRRGLRGFPGVGQGHIRRGVRSGRDRRSGGRRIAIG